MPKIDDNRDLPVPDPDGSPIHPRELAAAERRMLADMEREEPPAVQEPNGDLTAARQAIERQNSREMSEDEAMAYRLAPENTLDWLGDPLPAQDEAVLERWENHLDWLTVDQREVEHTRDREPERER